MPNYSASGTTPVNNGPAGNGNVLAALLTGTATGNAAAANVQSNSTAITQSGAHASGWGGAASQNNSSNNSRNMNGNNRQGGWLTSPLTPGEIIIVLVGFLALIGLGVVLFRHK